MDIKKSLRFCYRLEKEVGMAQDKDGNNIEAFVCCKIEDVAAYNIPKKEYKECVEEMRNLLARQLGTDSKFITPITLNEYLDNEDREDMNVIDKSTATIDPTEECVV